MNAIKAKHAFDVLLLLLACIFAREAFCADSLQGRLEGMAREADLVFKGQAISDRAITNAAFPDWGRPHATEFNVVSIFKGKIHSNIVTYLHITGGPMAWSGRRPPPHYAFDVGQSYLVFGIQSDKADWLYTPSSNFVAKSNEIRQIMSGEIPIRTLDARPLGNLSVKDAHWLELNLLLNDANPTNQLYAIDKLDQMSLAGRGDDEWRRSDDFKRETFLAALLPLVTNSNEQVGIRAINCFAVDPKSVDTLKPFADALLKVANENPSSKCRLEAISSLSGIGGEAFSNSVFNLLKDPDENVRTGAVRLLPRFSTEFAEQALRRCAADDSPKVRAAVADVIGDAKLLGLLPTLVRLFAEPADLDETGSLLTAHLWGAGVGLSSAGGEVHSSAGYALLKFDLEQVSDILKTNLSDVEFRLGFIRKLAPNGDEPHLPLIAEALKAHTANSEQEAANIGFHWGLSEWLMGNYAWAWDTLFKHISAQTRGALRSPQNLAIMDALQIADDPGDERTRSLYGFFLDKGLIERAKQLRLGIIRRTEDKAIDKKSFGFPEKLKAFDEIDRKHALKPGLGL